MSQGQLPGVFGDVQPVLQHYGYLAVGGFVLLEDFGVPVPGETTLIAAAVLAGTGHMNIALVIVVALGAVLWVCTWAFLGYFAGENISAIYAGFERFKWYVIGAAAPLVVEYVAFRVRRRRTAETT